MEPQALLYVSSHAIQAAGATRMDNTTKVGGPAAAAAAALSCLGLGGQAAASGTELPGSTWLS